MAVSPPPFGSSDGLTLSNRINRSSSDRADSGTQGSAFCRSGSTLAYRLRAIYAVFRSAYAGLECISREYAAAQRLEKPRHIRHVLLDQAPEPLRRFWQPRDRPEDLHLKVDVPFRLSRSDKPLGLELVAHHRFRKPADAMSFKHHRLDAFGQRGLKARLQISGLVVFL